MSKRRSGMQLSRRGFLKGLASAGALGAFPTIVPSTVFGQQAPSNRLQMGVIGVGGMGTGNMHSFLGMNEVQVVAVCDVDRRHLQNARNAVNQRNRDEGCRTYTDFREMFAKEKLDLATIAVPDHWHALLAVEAAKHGCDIYGEKPLARSIREGRAIVNAVERYGRVWQTGSWQRSESNFRRACELVRNGRLGKVHRVDVGLPNGGGCDPRPPKPVPEYLDWDLWLGPAPWRPFCEFGGNSPHWDWRWIMDYSGGQMTDWIGHHLDIAHWGMGLDRTGPVTVEGRGEYPQRGLYDAPMTYKFTCTYADGLEIVVGSGSEIGFGGTKFYGERGWIHVDRGLLNAEPKGLLNEKIGPGEILLPVSPGHHRDFINCVKTRAQTLTPAETALRSVSVGLLGEIAMLTGRKIRWNPVREEIIDDPGAAALLMRPYREPWALSV